VSLKVTVSAGVAAVARGEHADLEGLLRGADAALYAAKRAGRNRVVASSGGGGSGLANCDAVA
jgi:diguanylate cyclase (GGDEF)-like protein